MSLQIYGKPSLATLAILEQPPRFFPSAIAVL